MRRESLAASTSEFDFKLVEATHPVFQCLPAADDDVVLLLKHQISSHSLSQPPLLILPSHVFQRLGPAKLEVMPRNAFSKRHARGYLKTADVIEKEPWSFTRGAAFFSEGL